MVRLAVPGLSLACLSGCDADAAHRAREAAESPTRPAVAEAAFPREWARTRCEREASCDRADFHQEWGSLSECIDLRSTGTDFANDWHELVCGAYDPVAADHCLDALDADTCADFDRGAWRDACVAVYGC
jgi:hypothetical protein